MQQTKNVFSKFTNKYELSKTLKFELKPILKTQEILEENNVFQKDELIQKKYQETKKYFDRLHREFVSEALQNAKLSNLENYYKILRNTKNISKNALTQEKKNAEIRLRKEEQRLRKEIVESFNTTAKKWATEKYTELKNKNLKFFDEEAVFEKVLLERYGKDIEGNYIKETLISTEKIDKKTQNIIIEKKSIFEDWKGFTGYFKKFFETRKNFYKDDGTASAIATRIIDQNLRRFIENIEIIQFIQKNYPNFAFDNIIQKYQFNLDEICNLNFYASHCLLQSGIDDYNKNFIGEMKYAINLYRQANKGDKIPYLKTLDKQILSEKEKFIDEIKDDLRLKEILNDFLKTGEEKIGILKNLFQEFIEHQENFDLEKIYFSKKGFEQISRMWTGETILWEESLADSFGKNGKKLTKKKDAGYSFPDFIPLARLRDSLEDIYKKNDQEFWKEKYGVRIDKTKNIWQQFLQIFELEWKDLLEKEIQTEKGEKIVGYEISFKELRNLLNEDEFEKNKEMKRIVKEFADSFLSVYQFSKYFAVEKSKKWDDEIELEDVFYHHPKFGFLDKFYQGSFDAIITPYNLLRNYLTKKPWENVQKWKLNFGAPSLATGWDRDLESQRRSIILKKDEEYFLAILEKNNNHIFKDEQNLTPQKGDEIIHKMYFKQQTNVFRQLPRFGFPYKINKNKNLIADGFRNFDENKFKKRKEKYGLTDELLFIKDEFDLFQSSKERGDIFNKEKLAKLINYYKKIIDVDYRKVFEVEHILEKEYSELNRLYQDFEKLAYELTFKKISKNILDKFVEEKKVYLFKIYNKDFSNKSSGGKNLHTLYFQSLFNIKNTEGEKFFQLGANAEVFYRPKAIDAKSVKRNFKREIIEKKRYTQNKIFFHCPIKLNAGSEGVGKGYDSKFNRKLNEFLANNSDINIIGVDRGEKHLAYYSVINQKEEILDSGSLNFVGEGKDGKAINYHEKLEKKADEREQARKDWQTVEGIKDLKKGYISQVVRKLADLAIEHNAIIVFEDLNMRFKQIRGGIEKSIYQQLEKALIEKLNFLVNKGETDAEKAGHLLKAYQLSAPFTTFKEMGKQTGIIFYTQANYTSKIDPITGWRPNLYLKYSNAEKAKKEILQFDKIEFINNRFEFTYNLMEFINSNKTIFPQRIKWTLCSCIERFYWNRKLNNNKGGYEHYKNLTEEFKKLFKENKINVSENILKQIQNIKTKGNEKFFEKFIFLFKLLCQIRNTDKEAKNLDNQDFIFSPIAPFFDSRKNNRKHLPKNGDDNGAYNIARKGIIILKRISQWKNENKKNSYPDLSISNTDWDNFAQK